MLPKTPLLALGWLLSGCAGAGLVQDCSRRGNSVNPPPVAVVLDSAVAQIDMALPITVFCQDGVPVATAVSSRVVDGADLPISSTSTAPLSSSVTGYETIVSFTPDGGGVYSVTSTFEPSLGVTQRAVQVVIDRAGQPPLATRAGCSGFALLASALICQRADGLEVLRDGVLVQHLAATESLAAGPVLWAWAEGTVTRLEDRGTGPLVETGSAPFPGASAARRTASPTQLASVSLEGTTRTYQELRFGGAGLVGRTLALPSAPLSSTSGLLLAGEDTVAYGTSSSTICVVTLAPVSASCRPTALTLYESEAGVLWARGSAGDPAVGYVRVVGGGLATTFLTGRAPETLRDTLQPRPLFHFQGRSVLPRVPELVLESWAPTTDAAGVGQGVVWFLDANGIATVYARGGR